MDVEDKTKKLSKDYLYCLPSQRYKQVEITHKELSKKLS